MILIADSGSTKCDWVLVDEGEKTFTKTMGFNPFFHSSEYIRQNIEKDHILKKNSKYVTEIFYYGAGCSSAHRNRTVKEALVATFPSAKYVSVQEDMVGAAIAACEKTQGIVCILGTGSNSCFFDGEKIKEDFPALGFILGDEGSGAYFGKQLLAHYLYKTLPEEIYKAIQGLRMSDDDFISAVYNKPHANVFLASLMKTVSDFEKHPFMTDMVYRGFKEFAEIHIKCFDNYEKQTIHFLGSIAYFYEDQLKKIASEFGFTMGNIVRQPIHKLADFHEVHHELED